MSQSESALRTAQTVAMAFMMPVVKNDWNIYKSGRSRRSSECSNPQSCRSRKVSECKSEGPSLSTSPGSDFVVVSVVRMHGGADRKRAVVDAVGSSPGCRSCPDSFQPSAVESPVCSHDAATLQPCLQPRPKMPSEPGPPVEEG